MTTDRPRLFVALWPESREQVNLHRVAASLMPKGARPVIPENLHLTLRYLGPVEAERRACVERVLAEVEGTHFSLSLDRADYFEHPRVVWIGSRTPPEAIFLLQRQVEERLAECGFVPEPRPFVPHVTVARKVRSRPRFPPFEGVVWEMRQLALVESITRPEGVRYRPVRCWRLRSFASGDPSGA